MALKPPRLTGRQKALAGEVGLDYSPPKPKKEDDRFQSPPRAGEWRPSIAGDRGAKGVGGMTPANLWTGAPVRAALPASDFKAAWDTTKTGNLKTASTGYISPSAWGAGEESPGGYGQPPRGGWGGGGRGTPDVKWSVGYTLDGAPSWWKGMVADQVTPMSTYAMSVNALIPYLSVEDQRNVASSLSRIYPDAFKEYDPQRQGFPVPPKLTGQDRTKFLSASRGAGAEYTLDLLSKAMGGKEMGEGFEYLSDLANILSNYGAEGDYGISGGTYGKGVGQGSNWYAGDGSGTRYDFDMPAREGGMTRLSYDQMMSAVDPMLAETQGDQLGAYASIARMLTMPYFTGGQLMGKRQMQDGSTLHGVANKRFF